MTGVITTGVRMTGEHRDRDDRSRPSSRRRPPIRGRTGSTINAANPASRRVVVLFVAFKHQFAFPRRFFVKEIAFAVKTGQLLSGFVRRFLE